jgi:transketolase
MADAIALRDAFGEALLEVGKRDPNIIALTADLAESLRMVKFEEAFPDRFLDVGVAEENLAGVAAGYALGGFIPFAGSFGCFLTRAFDHVRVSICQNNLHVVLVGSHGGVSNAADGASAHALEDLAMMRSLPNMAVVVPADANEMRQAVGAVARHPGPVYLRLYREPTPVFTDRERPFSIGKAAIERRGRDVTVVGCGPQVATALAAAETLAGTMDVEVMNCSTLQPIDASTIVASAKKTGRVVTIEDHNVHGGLGDAVAEVLGEHFPVSLTRLGSRSFGESGSYADVARRVGIDVESLVEILRERGAAP